MKPTAALRAATWIYDRIWPPVMPFLRRHHRLAEGFELRLADPPPGPADIWIQAASAGEAYIALELAKMIHTSENASILLTTNTRQGLEIIKKRLSGEDRSRKHSSINAGYFPFDRPRIMQRVADTVNPGVMVLVETEIWPGHLQALKQIGCFILLINGRLTTRSLNRYRLWPGMWRQLSPDEILAISDDDADRFKKLFSGSAVSTMPNMKFDRLMPDLSAPARESIVEFLPTSSPFIVLGSVRQQEEQHVAQMLNALLKSVPQAVIGLFPRHMERMDYWRMTLDGTGLRWQYRSQLNTMAEAGSVLLWDRFGELAGAYASAQAAFVGGSLAPLGGQNFLEPLQSGVIPVIGPYWDNFHWVGREIASEELLRVAGDWRSAADLLVETVKDNHSRTEIQAAAGNYIDARRGGTRQAADLVLKYLRESGR